MSDYTEIRVRELESYGDWPWRYIVEGLTAARMAKPWPWSRTMREVPPRWEQLQHGLRDFQPCQASDASALAAQYRKRLSPAPTSTAPEVAE